MMDVQDTGVSLLAEAETSPPNGVGYFQIMTYVLVALSSIVIFYLVYKVAQSSKHRFLVYDVIS